VFCQCKICSFSEKLTTFAKSKTFLYKKKILTWLGACVRTRMLIVQEKSDLVIRIRIRNVLRVYIGDAILQRIYFVVWVLAVICYCILKLIVYKSQRSLCRRCGSNRV
jgi:hypothetical protein